MKRKNKNHNCIVDHFGKDCPLLKTEHQCDYSNPEKKGRAYWVCKSCGKDISLEVVLLYEATHPN